MKNFILILICAVALNFAANAQTWDIGHASNPGGASSVTAIFSGSTLTINGAGMMVDFSTAPWNSVRNIITIVIIQNGITSIGNNAFEYCDNLTSVGIPNSVMTIGNYAFSGCRSLTSVDIPNSVTSIRNWAFAWCSSLMSVDIPNSVMTIGNNVFWGCNGLTSINVASDNPNYSSENGVLFNKDKSTLITYPGGKHDFVYTIPNSVTSIGSSAFYNCSGLRSITIPNSVTIIGSSAFGMCTNLTSVYVEWDNPISIGSSVFSYVNTSNIDLHVPDGTVQVYRAAPVWNTFRVKDAAIWYIGSPTTNNVIATFIDSVLTISGTGNMQNWVGVTSVPWNLVQDKITTVVIQNGVTSIGNFAFYHCTSLTSVSIPHSVTSIGNSAFAGCTSLMSVIIPNSVTNIGISVFAGCTSLHTVITTMSRPPSISPSVFQNVDLSNCTLFVPQSSITAYQAANVWKDFYSFKTFNVSDNTLASLLVRPATFITAFDPKIENYDIHISQNTQTLSISATNDNFATIEGIGTKTLAANENSFEVKVTALDGSTKTYTFNIIERRPRINDATLRIITVSEGILVPEFNEGITHYTLNAPRAEFLTINAEANVHTASIVGIGLRRVLTDQINIFDVEVTAENGTTKRTYTISTTNDPITSAPELTPATTIRVYPNPTTGAFTLEFDTDVQHIVSIFDAAGRMLSRQTVNAQSVEMNISGYPDGIYIVTVNDSEMIRIIKE
jgi:hypothetical protein